MSAKDGTIEPLGVLLADANILIDLAETNSLGLIGKIIQFGIAKVYVPRTIYDEVATLISETQVAELGLTLLPAQIRLTHEALGYEDKRLSVPDRVLLLTALHNGYAAWTNDKRLRDNCASHGVKTYWEFEVLKLLVQNDYMSAKELIAVAESVESNNIFIKGVAARLREQLLTSKTERR